MLCVLFRENCISWVLGYKSLLAQALTLALFFLVLRILVEQGKCYLTGETEPVSPVRHEFAELEVPAT